MVKPAHPCSVYSSRAAWRIFSSAPGDRGRPRPRRVGSSLEVMPDSSTRRLPSDMNRRMNLPWGGYAVATAAGATVHRSAEIRPDLGTRPGKGEAMWKSLFVTSGELLVFMDADLVDWDTHFVPGLLGPLLTDPGVELVKGFYERPMM